MEGRSHDFDAEVARLKSAIEKRLSLLLRPGDDLEDGVDEMVGAAAELTLRPAKRFRGMLLIKTCEGYGGNPETALDAACALEMLQGYLLIHDDIMDRADTRRGGPTAHLMLETALSRFGGDDAAERGVHMAILAGDYLEAAAVETLSGLDVSGELATRCLAEYGRLVKDVVKGQALDEYLQWMGRGTEADVLTVHRLKTAAYTTLLPMSAGALLAGVDDAELERIRAFAEPLGVAFQLRDDMLGTWGNENSTGKPGTGDLEEGKVNYPVAWAMEHTSIFDKEPYPWEDTGALSRALEECGAKDATQLRYDALGKESADALKLLSVGEPGRRFIEGLMEYLRDRFH